MKNYLNIILASFLAFLPLAWPGAAQEDNAATVPDEQVVEELAAGGLGAGHDMPPPPPRHAGGRVQRSEPPMRKPDEDRMPPPVRYFFKQLRQENPAEYERLLKLRVENREQFMYEISKRLPHRKNAAEEKFRQLDRQCWEIADQLRVDPAPENAEELQQQLNALVAESVDSMIAETKRRLEEIQARLKQMERLRDRIVQQRMEFYLKAPKNPPEAEN